MSLENWAQVEDAIAEKFSEAGVIGGRWLGPLIREERAYGAALITTYKGFDLTENAFFDFYIESLHLAAASAFWGQLPKTDRHYTMLYLTYLTLFRGFRAASTLKNYGYPLRAFAALRDLKDRAIHIGAVVNGISDILAIHGFDPTQAVPNPLTKKDYKKIRNRRTKEQRIAISRMVGSESDLAPDDVVEMEKLRDLYHEEVHGGRLGFIFDLKSFAIDKRLPNIGPRPQEDNLDMASYTNRAIEIGWMVLRSLPYLTTKGKVLRGRLGQSMDAAR